MKLQHQTILITGGSSGIGLELARQLLMKNNKVIICGRSLQRLEAAKALLPKVQIVKCDISKQEERKQLLKWISEFAPNCNVLVNNAAIVNKTSFLGDEDMIEKAEDEIKTNLIAPIALSKKFLPLFKNQQQSSIVNITTGLVYAPRAVYPIYNATKAALHSFTQVLRQQLLVNPTEIIEVMMPVVDTPWHKGTVPKIAIKPGEAVSEMIKEIEKGKKEIRIGKVKLLYVLSRIAPAFAFKKINQVE